MNRAAIAASVAGLAVATSSAATVGPFTETFESGFGGFVGSSGAPTTIETDGSNAFIRTTRPVALDDGGMISAETVIGNSVPGNGFAGDYLAGSTRTISFDVRHDSPVPLNFLVRLTPITNFPGQIFLDPVPVVASPDFTTVSFLIDPNSPLFISSGGGDPLTTLPNINNIQLLVGDSAAPIPGEVTFEIDNVSVVPTPSAAATLALAGIAATRRRR